MSLCTNCESGFQSAAHVTVVGATDSGGDALFQTGGPHDFGVGDSITLTTYFKGKPATVGSFVVASTPSATTFTATGATYTGSEEGVVRWDGEAAASDPIADLITLCSPLILFSTVPTSTVVGATTPPADGGAVTTWTEQSGNTNNGTGEDTPKYYTSGQPGIGSNSTGYFALGSAVTRSGTAWELWAVFYRVAGTYLPLLGSSSFTNATIMGGNLVVASEEEGGGTNSFDPSGLCAARIRCPNDNSATTAIATGIASVNIFASNAETFSFAELASYSGGPLVMDSQNRLRFLMLCPAISSAGDSTTILGLINSNQGTSLTLG